jgi:hypothetical protein
MPNCAILHNRQHSLCKITPATNRDDFCENGSGPPREPLDSSRRGGLRCSPAKAPVPVLGKGRMVRDLAIQTEPTKPAIREIEMNLLAQAGGVRRYCIKNARSLTWTNRQSKSQRRSRGRGWGTWIRTKIDGVRVRSDRSRSWRPSPSGSSTRFTVLLLPNCDEYGRICNS